MKIGTHSGHFHADEALAVWMLKQIPQYSTAEIVRSRDQAVLEECDIVVDVGGKYEPPKWYDHHQREFTTTFDDEHTVTKLSSAGLIYKHYGKDVLNEILGKAVRSTNASSESKQRKLDLTDMVESVYMRVYNSFIEAVDGMDNGVTAYNEKPAYSTRGMMLQSVVGNLSPNPGEDSSDEVMDKQFEKASNLMGLAFEAEVRSLGLGWYVSRSTVQQAYNDRFKYDKKGRIMVLEEAAYWKEVLTEIESEDKDSSEKILYVLYPTSDSFRIQAVSVEPGSFESRKALPQAWRGLRDADLDAVTGVENGVFVHASGFIGGNRSREGAITMALKAADNQSL